MKKILVLAHSSSIGGAELALAGLIKSTADIFEWTIVFPSKVTPEPTLVESVVAYHMLELPWWCYEAHDSPQSAPEKNLLKSLDKLQDLASKADILMTNTITIPWLGLIASNAGKPHIWYVHEFGDLDHNLKFLVGYEASLKIIAETSSRVLTISTAVKKHLEQIIPSNKIDIIRQSIDLDELLKLDIHRVANFSSPIRLLSLGAIKPSKGQAIVVEALLSSSNKNISLDIVGPVADQAYYEKLVSNASGEQRISLQARRYDPLEELKLHDAVIMSSSNEAMGRVTLEAMAAGRAVIGYASPSTKEILAADRGILYSPNSAAALSDVFNNLNILGKVNLKKARLYVKANHSSVQQTSDFLACVNDALIQPVALGAHYKDFLEKFQQHPGFSRRTVRTRRYVRQKVSRITPALIKKIVKRVP